MAAPHVAGAAALIKSIAPDLSYAEVKALLLNHVDPTPALSGKCVTGGRLNLRASMENTRGGSLFIKSYELLEDSPSNGDGLFNPGEEATIAMEIINRGLDPASNIVATISFSSPGSYFNVITGTVHVGNLDAGETIIPVATFKIASDPTSPTPHAEQADVEFSYLSLGNNESSTKKLSITAYSSSIISGQVTTVPGNPISNAKVRYNGVISGEVTTDAQGNYSVILAEGTYSMYATSTGFVDSVDQTVTLPPSQSDINFLLGNPQIDITPDPLRITMDAGVPALSSLCIENSGDVPLLWEIKKTSGAALLSDEDVPLKNLSDTRIGGIFHAWTPPAKIELDIARRGRNYTDLKSSFTSNTLNNVDLLLLSGPPDGNDVPFIRDWIYNGGRLAVVMGKPLSSSLPRVNSLLADTGISMQFIAGFPWPNQTVQFIEHPATIGVSDISVDKSLGCNISGNALALGVNESNEVIVATSSYGLGRVVVGGFSFFFYPNSTSDQYLLSHRIIDWLADRWFEIETDSGTIPPGECHNIELRIDPAGLGEGAHTTEVAIASNDPILPESIVPVILEVASDAPNIFIDLPQEVNETDGFLANAGMASLAEPAISNITVALASCSAKVDVPPSVVIPTGSTNAMFDITLINDGINHGPLTISVIGSATSFVPGKGTMLIHDDDTPILSVQLPTEAREGDGVLTNAGMVSVQLALPEDAEVLLTSTDTSEITVPSSVIMLAGQSNALFDITVVNDTGDDGRQQASVDASSADMIMIDGSSSMSIADNDLHHFEFGPLATTQVVASTKISYAIQAINLDEEFLPDYNGTASLTATGDNGTHKILPLRVTFTNGSYSGSSWLKFVDTGVTLTVNSGGHTGTSTVFDVVSSSFDATPTAFSTVLIPTDSSDTRQLIISNAGNHELTFDILLMSEEPTSFLDDDELIAYYPFNGNANDESGYDYNGTVSNATLTPDRFGYTNSSFHFSGDHDCFIDIPDCDDLQLENTTFSISYWIKPDYVDSKNITVPVFEKGSNNNGWSIGINSWDNNTNRYYLSLFGGIRLSHQLRLNAWEHIVSVYKESENEVGVYSGYLPVAGFHTPLSVQQLPILNVSTNSLKVGKQFSGIIDDIRIYRRALEPTEILELYRENIINNGSMSVSASNGTVAPGESMILDVYYNSTGMVAGECATEIIKIISNDSFSRVLTIPVSMKVVP